MKKKTNFLIYPFVIMGVCLMLTSACKKDEKDDNPPADNPPVNLSYKKYLVAGSYGDIINYDIDNVNKKFRYFNETTGVSDSGTFVFSTNVNLNGVYEITAGGNFFYGIELQNKMFATSMPSGNHQNSLCFGITADTDLSTQYSTNDFVGKYIWVIYHDLSDFQWGGYEMFANGTFTWQFGPDDDGFDEAQHFAGAGTGTWAVSTTDPSRIIFTESSVSNIGTVYPGKYMLIDNGPGMGFTAGIKYPSAPISQASIAGSYKYIDVTPEGYLGVGAFDLPASGTNCNVYSKYYNNPYASEENGTMTNFHRSTTINNTYIGESLFEGDLFYTSFIVLPGEALLFYTWGDIGMVSYGIAGKVN